MSPMADEPRFPSPDEAKRKNADARVAPSEPRAAIVVRRAEPVPESVAKDAKKGQAAKLTPEEVRALLAVSETNRPNKLWRRGRVIMVPTIVLSVIAHFFMAYWPIAVGLLVIGALVYVFGPWGKKQDEWGG